MQSSDLNISTSIHTLSSDPGSKRAVDIPVAIAHILIHKSAAVQDVMVRTNDAQISWTRPVNSCQSEAKSSALLGLRAAA